MKKQNFRIAWLIVTLFIAISLNAFAQTKVTGTLNGTPRIADGVPAVYEKAPTAVPTITYLDAQNLNVTVPTCAGETGPLNPQPGTDYDYTVTVQNTGSTIHWFVTDELNIIAAVNDITGTLIDPGDGSDPYIVQASGSYNVVDNTSPTVNITWKSFNGATTPVLLVTYVVDASGCTDNIQVYRIEPVFNFVININPIQKDGTKYTNPEECISPVEEAIYNAGTGELEVDYGENWLYFVVAAKNFYHSWMPEFQVTYAGAGDIEVWWTYPGQATSTDDADWYQLTENAGIYSGDEPVLHSGTTTGATPTVGVDEGDGEFIIVRVRIDHGTDENPVPDDQNVTLAVNGRMYDAAAASGAEYANEDLDDVSDDFNGDNACDQLTFGDDDFEDLATITLTARPSIDSATDTSPTDTTPVDFEPKSN